MFKYVDYIKSLGANKVCTTTNGHRLAKDKSYAERFFASGLTHVNISLMATQREQQCYITGSKTFVSLDDMRDFKQMADKNGVMLRVNNNVFVDNNDSLEEILEFYRQVRNYCHSVKFSPLLKTDSFSTVNEVTEFNRTHILSDECYDNLWHSVEEHFTEYPLVRNKETFGFVEYSMILLPAPIILNYNQHGQLRNKIVNERKINNIKLLTTGELSLSWNREEKDYFIECV